MQNLQELIRELGLATRDEITRAIFASPDLGVIAALEKALPTERAERLLAAIAEKLALEIIDRESLLLPQNLAGVKTAELLPAISKYRAFPFRKQNGENPGALCLATADPLHEEGRAFFSQALMEDFTLYLAREEDIQNAFSFAAARRPLNLHEESLAHQDAHLPSQVRNVEDPEVRKAVQQVTATAVKHRASMVHIDLHAPFTRASFQFENGQGSGVEISVSPVAFLASLLRRGQILTWESDYLQAVCRVRFKSTSVNLILECAAMGEAAAPPTSWRDFTSVMLRDFQIDSPDNPGFWRSINEEHAGAINRFLESASGMLVLASLHGPTREFALRSLAESYPDATVVDVDTTSVSSDLLARAKDHRVIVATAQADVFGALTWLTHIPVGDRQVIRGIVAYHQLPRNCPFCSTESLPATSLLQRLPEYVHLGSKSFQMGQGCEVCSQKGILGFQGTSSVVDFSGVAGISFRQGEPADATLEALSRDCFHTLLQDAVAASAAGRVPFEAILRDIPLMPEWKSQERTESKSELPTNPKPVYAETSVSGDRPIRGRGAFLLSPKDGSDDAELDLRLQAEASSEPTPSTVKSRPERVQASRPTVLVIDDDADQRAVLRRVFELAGYHVEVAADGIDGIVSAVRIEPQLIVVDFMMPELDGRETVRRLRQGSNTSDIPIVALTAYADPEVELGLLQAGADDFCAKSVSKQVLLKRVERLLKQPREQRSAK